jgi:hypothetical protein
VLVVLVVLVTVAFTLSKKGTNMKFAIIENTKVVNIALADTPLESNWVSCDTAEIGDLYENGEFNTPVLTESVAADARQERNNLLAATDWTAMADAPTQATAMTTYRQALRDITSQSGWPTTINWPTKP